MRHALSKDCDPPLGCFECKYEDCIYNGHASDEEKDFNNRFIPHLKKGGTENADDMPLQGLCGQDSQMPRKV